MVQTKIGSATRPIFIPNMDYPGVIEKQITFDWHMGMSSAVKKRSVLSLHEKAKENNIQKILEASSKSEEPIGIRLSAFFLRDDNGIAVENLFQSSKVFQGGLQFKDLLNVTALEAKKDPRLKNSGAMEKFYFNEKNYPLDPKSLFYDWLYSKVLFLSDSNTQLKDEFLKKHYDAFSDIEFNPNKSFSCQARTLALIVSLYKNNIINDFLLDPINTSAKFKLYCINKEQSLQGNLF